MAVDLTPTPVAPAVVSYTPLDLSGVKSMLDTKVQQVETGAAGAREFLSTLDFKEGPFSRGNAALLTKKYSDQIKGLIDELYSTGDTRAFGTNLAGVANAVNTDPLAEASLADYKKYQEHLKLASDPRYATYDFSYTKDKKASGDIEVPPGYDPTKLTPDMVSTLYGIYPAASPYEEYTQKYKTLATNKYEQFLGRDENGLLVMRTTDETRELPLELQEEVKRIMSQPGANAYTLLAQGLREVSPELYNTLRNDYEGQDTETMVNYRQSLELSADEAIGRVIENSMPYLNPSSTTLQTPPGGGGGPDGSELPPTTEVTTRAFATNLASPVGAEQGIDMVTEVFDYINLGDSQTGQLVEILGSENQQEREVGAYAISVINNLYQVGDAAHPFLTPERIQEIDAKAKEQEIEIMQRAVSRMDEGEVIPGAPQESWLQNNIFNAATADQRLNNLNRLRNTFGLLGVTSLAEFTTGPIADRQEIYQEALDQFDALENSSNQGIVNQLTYGVGVLTKSEFTELIEPYLQGANGNTKIDSYRMTLSGEARWVRVRDIVPGWSGQTAVDRMLSDISNASNTINGKTRPDDYGARQDVELQQMAESDPIAFRELMKRDYVKRAQLYFTDVLARPGQNQRDVITAAAVNDGKNWGAEGPDFFTRWDIKSVESAEMSSGFGGMGATLGDTSPRITDQGGIRSAYSELEAKDQVKVLNDFTAWANLDGKEIELPGKKGYSFIFNGIIYPGGQQSETGLLFSKVNEKGKITGQYVFQPKDATSLTVSETYTSMSLSQKTLAGKQYAGVVNAGDAFQGQYVGNLQQELEDDADMYGIVADYMWTDTKAELDGTQRNRVSEKLSTTGADNIYFDGNYSVVADISDGEEVYKIKNKDNTEVTWGEYFGSITQNLDESQYHIGTSDYEALLLAMVKNQEMLKARGLDVSEDKIRELLLKDEMGTVQSFANHFGAGSLSEITENLPIIFIDSRAAYKHFSGQSAHPTDRYSNPTAGFFPKKQ